MSPEEIGFSLKMGYCAAAFSFAVTVILLFLNWRRRDFRWLPLYAALLLIHPPWMISVYTGDCGYVRRFFSVAISVVFAAMLLCQLFRPQLRVRWFLLILSGVCWFAYGVSCLYWQIVDYPSVLGFVSSIFTSEAIESFIFASSAVLEIAILVSVASAFLYALSWRRSRNPAV